MKDPEGVARERKLLSQCRNCGYYRVSVEPVQRFRETHEEMGAAMAISLGPFSDRAHRDPDAQASLLH